MYALESGPAVPSCTYEEQSRQRRILRSRFLQPAPVPGTDRTSGEARATVPTPLPARGVAGIDSSQSLSSRKGFPSEKHFSSRLRGNAVEVRSRIQLAPASASFRVSEGLCTAQRERRPDFSSPRPTALPTPGPQVSTRIRALLCPGLAGSAAALPRSGPPSVCCRTWQLTVHPVPKAREGPP